MDLNRLKEMLELKKLVAIQLIDETSRDNEEHIIYHKKDKKIVSKHSDKKSAYVEMIQKHNFHPDMTVLHKSEYKLYGVEE